jgi:uncharacterized protein (DUF1697 family)
MSYSSARMAAIVCMLRGVNVGGNNKIKMEALRALCESLGLLSVQTHIQSGNVVFKTQARDLPALAKRIEDAIEQGFGFRPAVILRTTAQLREVIARNPFAQRPGLEPSKLLVTFFASEPDAAACEKVAQMDLSPEELHFGGREHYMYFPNGMARPKTPLARIEKLLKTTGTGRNWNTVQKLLEMAEKL